MKRNETASQSAPFAGRTFAYRRFHENIWRTKQLLEVGLSGLTGRIEQLDDLLDKFQEAGGLPGPVPKDYEPQVDVSPTDENGVSKVSFDGRTAWMVRKALEGYRKKHAPLRFHLYLVLTVTIWGAFETYLIMLFEELYRMCPELLKSDEVVLFRDVVDHRTDVVDLLIERQIDRMGHFTLQEMFKYLDDRINFRFSSPRQKRLSEFHLVRNIVAHNTGIVRSDLEARIPKSIRVVDNELRITKQFLQKMLNAIEKSVASIEKHVIGKFFKK
jgi:hypothetical protein